MNLTDINDIRLLLDRHGFRFSKSLGQNFLTASWVPEQIADCAGIDGDTAALEIGPGIGCLTRELSQRAGKVVAIELDKSLESVLNETLSGCGNAEVVFGDALKMDLKKFAGEKFGALRPVVCANLPYNVTTPLLTEILTSGIFDSVTVMIQKEVAQRICALPNTADYGAFTVFCQWYTEPEMLFNVPPSCFIPQPKVTSSVIHMKRRAAPPAKVNNEELMFKIVRAAFNQRRKTFVNAVSSGLGCDKQIVESSLKFCELDARIRGEALSIAQFAQISDEIERKF